MVLVERSSPPPKSLEVEARKKNGSHSKPDVVERLRRDFHDKCYICELKGLQDPEVEHLIPHENGRYPSRKFDWENLFWSCGHCNRVKSKAIYSEGIIDCCRRDPQQLNEYHNNSAIKISVSTASFTRHHFDALHVRKYLFA